MWVKSGDLVYNIIYGKAKANENVYINNPTSKFKIIYSISETQFNANSNIEIGGDLMIENNKFRIVSNNANQIFTYMVMYYV